jgi:hypothetical protein
MRFTKSVSEAREPDSTPKATKQKEAAPFNATAATNFFLYSTYMKPEAKTNDKKAIGIYLIG